MREQINALVKLAILESMSPVHLGVEPHALELLNILVTIRWHIWHIYLFSAKRQKMSLHVNIKHYCIYIHEDP